MKRFIHLSIIIPSLLLLSGCTSSLMQKSSIDNTVLPAPKPNQAQIVFMRPSSFGGAIQSSVFDLKQPNNNLADDVFIGIVSANTKVLYTADPGFHLFMVIGENADFMPANMAAGKTYSALVTPRMGWWKARFSLKPLHLDDLKSEDYKNWFDSTDWYENTDASVKWAQDNWSSIQSKKNDYRQKWDRKSDQEKDNLTLHESDSK